MNNDNFNTISTEEVTPTKKTFKNKNIIAIIVVVIALFSIIKSVGGIFSGISTTGGSNGGVTDDTYIGCAKQVISKSLKNPSSLLVNDAYVYEKDDYGSAIVCMDITCENGFGGADRDTVYVCVMYVKSDGKYKFNPNWNYTENVTNLDYLKSINGFGEPEK